ncbi:MAG: SigB/SigF/SigG family RNA polymerase sigma factor [Clostridia bacterium]
MSCPYIPKGGIKVRKVNICGMNTQNLPKLSQDESQELIKLIKNGDKNAQEKFVMANLRLVLSVVQRFYNKGDSDDLFQIGVVGLLKAISGFDLKYNVRFSTYAVPMIMGEIRRYVKDSTGIKVPRSMRDTAYKALRAREEMEKRSQKTPSLMEVASEIDIPLRQVVTALDAVSETKSLQESVYSDGEDSILLMEQISDCRENDENWTNHLSINQAIKTLPEKEKNVLIMRYFRGDTQIEISKKIGISQAQVSRLEKNALEKVKEFVI